MEKEKIDIVKIKMIREGSLDVPRKKIDSPESAYNIVRYLELEDREHLVVLAVNTKNVVVNISTISVGSLNSSIVHPREVFKTLILSNAASFLVAHNHPSGYTSPSGEDIKVTKILKECGKIFGIKLLDHIIVGEEKYLSFAEEGIL
ncbi:RadC family protein [Clostridium botulinum]|uniref:RadC family protein n=2 Tax=Clostridium botulinum TaxID=1491 RepID=UPI000773C45A|nr:DNA repair protein RadC [Clostridium botulinum]